MKKLALFLIATFFAVKVYSAYLRDVPIDLKQPNGAVIHCYITGDEYYRRVHDKYNYTIVQDKVTGYFVYATKRGNNLIPSTNIVGESDPSILQLVTNLDIPAQVIEEKRTEMLKSVKIVSENSTKGDFNNIVISIRFSDQSPTSLSLLDYENNFNSKSTVSLKSYYNEVSNSQLNVSSYIYPKPQNQTILEYQDSHPRAYYTEYHITDNPIGYKDGEVFDREKNLVKNAISFVNNQVAESQINFDLNNDGFIDNLIFIIQGNGDLWGKILWPSSMSMDGSTIFIGNKQVNRYNKQLSSMLNVGVICHEFFHTLGAPDLYRYTNKEIDPIGSWDIMGNSGTQHMTVFMKWKYGKWFDNIPEINQPGTYTLKPVSQSPFACYKIATPLSLTEYFIVEYRKKEGLLESTLPANYYNGLIIYRINMKVPWGNSEGPPDELYIYRISGDLTSNGDISKAAFSANINRKTFNNETNPTCFLNNGDKGWIHISSISNAGNEISLTINQIFRPPIANAGIDQIVVEDTTVMLDGSVSSDPDGDILTYKWIAPAGIILSSTTIANPTFTAPEVTKDKTYTFTLVVNDGIIDSQADQVVITVKDINQMPLANAGSNQTVNEGATVILDGSNSSDPDNNTLIYKWTHITSQDIQNLPNSPEAFIKYSPNGLDPKIVKAKEGTRAFLTLSASDDKSHVFTFSDKNLQFIVVSFSKAEGSKSIQFPAPVIGSYEFVVDGSEKGTLVIESILSSTTVANPTFTAPEIKKDSIISFSLVVNDGIENSAPATVKVTVLNVIDVGVSTTNSPLFKIYPNPTTGIVNIEFGGGKGSKTEVSVTSLLGAEIFRKETFDATNLQIDLSNQVSGMYLLRISNDNRQSVSIIVIRKD